MLADADAEEPVEGREDDNSRVSGSDSLVALGGTREVYGLNNKVDGKL